MRGATASVADLESIDQFIDFIVPLENDIPQF